MKHFFTPGGAMACQQGGKLPCCCLCCMPQSAWVLCTAGMCIAVELAADMHYCSRGAELWCGVWSAKLPMGVCCCMYVRSMS
jgi:hypothetical protein